MLKRLLGFIIEEKAPLEYDGKYCTYCGRRTHLLPIQNSFNAKTGKPNNTKVRFCSFRGGGIYTPDIVHLTSHDM